MAPEVSVVVAVHDARATLPVLLDALAGQDCAESFEVILSDDASTDGGLALADAFAERLALTVCRSPRRRGPGAARNAGAARARAPLLAFCDADDVPDRGWLRALCAAARVEPLVAGAVHHLNVPDRRMEPAELTAHYGHLPWTMTANLAIARELFEAVGGFAEVLRSGQDADLCWRLADRGVALGDASERDRAQAPPPRGGPDLPSVPALRALRSPALPSPPRGRDAPALSRRSRPSLGRGHARGRARPGAPALPRRGAGGRALGPEPWQDHGQHAVEVAVPVSGSRVLEFDEEASRRVEATYLTPDVVAQRRELLALLRLRAGERVVDIGSGPGLLASELAEAVGPDGAVTGVDPSESMLRIAAARRPAAGAAPLELRAGDALALPLADASVDVAVSTQVYEYVDDMPAALAEARRVLRPGGRLLVLDTDWDSIVWHSGDEERMRRVLAVWDEHLVHRGLPRVLGRLLAGGGLLAPGAGRDPDRERRL